MTVVHLAARFPPAIGGAERWCEGVARWQAGRGRAVRVVTLQALGDEELWGGGPPRRRAFAVGATDRAGTLQVRRVPAAPHGPALLHALGRLALRSLACPLPPGLLAHALRAARTADVVHAHGVPGTPAFVAWAAARAARRPLVATPHFHALEPVYRERPVLALLRRADAVLAVTTAERDALIAEGVPADRVVTTSNAVDAPAGPRDPAARATVRAALGVAADAPLVCTLGRKAPSKGLDVLLAALPHLQHRPRPVVVAAGPPTAWSDALPRPAGAGLLELPALTERQKPLLLAAADLLVLPSRNEAFGIVFLEAWAAGTPAVGAAIASVREVLDDDDATFRPDDPADLARAIDRLLGHPAHGARQVAAGRDRIARAHTWDRVGRDVDAAYRRALAR